MKKIRTLMLTALALIMGAMTAFASPENPTNEEVMTALTRATTVFEWFEHNPLPTDGKERFDSGYMLYYSVSDPTIHNKSIALGREKYGLPEREEPLRTHFIR